MPVLDESLLTVHNIHEVESSQCTLKDNRFKDPQSGYYCWKGIIFQQPNCIMGEVCDPVSFLRARDRFCVTFGGSMDPRKPGDTTCIPGRFVPNLDPSSPVVNERGGVVTYQPQAECKGISGWIRCVNQGFGKSIHSITGSTAFPHVMLFTAFLLGAAIFVRYNRPWLKRHFGVKGPIFKLPKLR